MAGDTSVEPIRRSHRFIMDSYERLRAEVRKLSDDAGPDWEKRLNQWVQFVEDQVRAIFLEVSSESDAFLIFETLNDRGADLTIADLLKNYLFGRAGSKLDVVRDAWMQSLGTLEISAENVLFTTFLRHYWSSYYGAVRERDLYRSIKEHVTTEINAVDFAEDLQKAANMYAAILHGDHDYWTEMGTSAKENIETLLRLNLEQNRPLILAALQHFPQAEVRKLIRSIVTWSVRGLIVGGIGGGKTERTYCEAAVKIRKGDVKTTDELFQEISRIVPSDDEFQSAFALARVPRSTLARYYLVALEKGIQGELEPELVPNENEEQVNIEHILPQRATEEDWGAHFAEDERGDYIYRLGNMALLKKGPNGRIGNKAFSEKKPVLMSSSFELTKQVATETDWTPEAIKNRQAGLAKLAVSVWPRMS